MKEKRKMLLANQEVIKWSVGLAVSLVVVAICAVAQNVL